jgi:imidazolonepropionase
MIDLLIAPCGQLLTLAGGNAVPRRRAGMSDVGLVEDGAVGINLSSGNVEYAGRAVDLNAAQLSPSCPVIDASGCVVLPGFVDSHTHLVFAGDRADEFYRRAQGESYQDIARAGGGIRKTMDATRAAGPEVLLEAARGRLHRLYDSGTTTVEVKTGYGLSREAELTALRVIRSLRDAEPGLVMATLLAAHVVPPEFAQHREEYVALCADLAAQAGHEGLADFCDVFVDPLAFNQAEAAQVVAAARHAGLGIKLHADEFGDDGTAAWGVGQGALSLDHLGGVGAQGIAALAGSSTVVTLLPATMFFSGHGRYAPARQMIEAGCAIALATDLNPGSSLVYSMPFVMTLAVLMMGLSAEECIVAGTVNGAHALGLGDQLGTLEPGKRADLIIAAVPHYRELAYHVGCDVIRDVIIRGRVVKRGGVMMLARA